MTHKAIELYPLIPLAAQQSVMLSNRFP